MSYDYSCSIATNAGAEQAFEAISDVSKWWATNFKGRAKFPRDRFTVRFGKTFSIMKVSAVVPATKMEWTIEESYLPLFKNPAQWNGTRIVWEISTGSDATVITMTHIGLTPETECYYDCEKGWNFYIRESLYKLITGGKGSPGTGIFSNISNGHRKYEGLLYFKSDPPPHYPDGYFFIDVKGTNGEQVTSAYSAADYNRETLIPVASRENIS